MDSGKEQPSKQSVLLAKTADGLAEDSAKLAKISWDRDSERIKIHLPCGINPAQDIWNIEVNNNYLVSVSSI